MGFRSLTIVDESNDISESVRNKQIDRSDKLFIGRIGESEDFDRYIERDLPKPQIINLKPL